MIYIYTTFRNNRLHYIANELFTNLLGVKYDFIADEKNIPNGVACINYSNKEIANSIHIVPSELMKSNQIDLSMQVNYEGMERDFKLTFYDETHFDPFAAAFYLLSRYEEYGNFEPDHHQRFPATASVLTKADVLDVPVVNYWALALKEQILESFPNVKFEKRQFKYISTIDIDQAWKYKHKGFRRNAGGLFSDLISTNWVKLKERFSVLSGSIEDPFGNYDYQDIVHKSSNVTPYYFVELGKRSTHDKNLPGSNKHFRSLIKRLDTAGDVGMHPSYTSNYDTNELHNEKDELASIVDRPITKSRQHFLMHKMPETYHRLIALGISEDHTMGYSTHLGFRAGIAAPFKFFDLEKDESTELTLYPFCMMDITPMHYMQLSVEESKTPVVKLMDAVKEVDGLFISLWHNESLSDSERWKGWRTLYEFILHHSQL